MLHDRPCQCDFVFLGEFLVGCAQEWNCGLGNKLPELSQRLLGGPLHCMPGRWFPKLPPHWNVLGLVKIQVFIAAWAYTALLRRLSGCEVLFHQAPGGFVDLHLEVPRLGLPFTCCVTLGELLGLSEPGYPPL